MTVVATSTSRSPAAEGCHHRLLLGGRQLAVQQPEAQPGELLGGEALVLGRRRGGVDALGALDERAHDVGLTAGRHLVAQALVDARPLERARPDTGRLDRRAPGGQLPQLRLVEVAVEEHRRGARDGRRRHHEHVRVVALPPQHVALLDAEAVLLVDHREAEAREPDTLLEQGVGADDDVDLAGVEPGGEPTSLRRARPRREERDVDGAVGQQAAVGSRR